MKENEKKVKEVETQATLCGAAGSPHQEVPLCIGPDVIDEMVMINGYYWDGPVAYWCSVLGS